MSTAADVYRFLQKIADEQYAAEDRALRNQDMTQAALAGLNAAAYRLAADRALREFPQCDHRAQDAN